MTLLLTECSTAGIVMAADSAITMYRHGKVVETDKRQWRKVLKVPSIGAVIGYWGFIGSITASRFDEWLERTLASVTFSDLPSLAQAIADALNAACHNKPLKDDHAVGVHIAGYHAWDDLVRRPMFYHVHNGPGEYRIEHVLQPLLQGNRLVEVRPVWVGGPRTLFEPHRDLPRADLPIEASIAAIDNGYTTRNGEFYYYSVVWEALQRSFNYLNLIKGFSIPSDPSKALARKGLLIAAVEMMIRLYKCSNRSRIIGGAVTAEAVGPNGILN